MRVIYAAIFSVNKDHHHKVIRPLVSLLSRRVTGQSRYYTGRSAGNRPRASQASENNSFFLSAATYFDLFRRVDQRLFLK